MSFSKLPLEIIYQILKYLDHTALFCLIKGDDTIAQYAEYDDFWRQMCKLHHSSTDQELDILKQNRSLQMTYWLLVRYHYTPMIREFTIENLTDKVAIMPYYIAYKYMGFSFNVQLEAPILIRMDQRHNTFNEILTGAKTITFGVKKTYEGEVRTAIDIDTELELINWDEVKKENTFISHYIPNKKYYISILNNHKESTILKNIQSDYKFYYH